MDPGSDSTPNPEFDLSDMERQIQSLLGGAAPQAAAAPAAIEDMPRAETRDVRAESIEAEPIDPLLREIDAALSDDADALLRGSNGDIGEAVRSVFDERALSGQEEEINRALIEAFGTSRVERPSFTQSVVTNPLPGFEGAARPLSPDIPREERDRAPEHEAEHEPEHEPSVAARDAAAAAGTTPHEAAAPHAAPASEATATNVVQPADQPAAQAPSPTAAAMPARAPLAEPKPEPTIHRSGLVMTLVTLPLRILASPMNALPEGARPVLTIAAVTLLLCAPVAWWLAQRTVKTPLVGPINILPAPAVASAEPPADASGGGH